MVTEFKVATLMNALRESHRVDYFSHIRNEHLTDDFFQMMERYKGALCEAIDKREPGSEPLDKDDLNYLSFLELAAYEDEHTGQPFVRLHTLFLDNSEKRFLTEYLLAPMLMGELREINDTLKSIDLVNNHIIREILGKNGLDKLSHDNRNEFFACYINSFIKCHPLKLKYALQSSINMAFDTVTGLGHREFKMSRLKDLQQASYLVAAKSLGIDVKQKLDRLLCDFDDDRIRELISHNFLSTDYVVYAVKLQSAMAWIAETSVEDAVFDGVIGDWLIHQCAIFYAHHQNEDRLKYFIQAIVECMADFFEYDRVTLEAINEAMFRQSILIEPETFKSLGYGKPEFLSPLAGLPSHQVKKFPCINGVYTKSESKGFSWLTLPSIQKIQDSCGFEISASDIIQHFSSKQHQAEVLKKLNPADYMDQFINHMPGISLTQSRQLATDLLEKLMDPDDIHRVQVAYLIKVVSSSKDKPLNPKSYAMRWLDKPACIAVLRDEGLLGKWAAISVLGLTSDDLRHDLHLLSNTSKRMLLSNHLEL